MVRQVDKLKFHSSVLCKYRCIHIYIHIHNVPDRTHTRLLWLQWNAPSLLRGDKDGGPAPIARNNKHNTVSIYRWVLSDNNIQNTVESEEAIARCRSRQPLSSCSRQHGYVLYITPTTRSALLLLSHVMTQIPKHTSPWGVVGISFMY